MGTTYIFSVVCFTTLLSTPSHVCSQMAVPIHPSHGWNWSPITPAFSLAQRLLTGRTKYCSASFSDETFCNFPNLHFQLQGRCEAQGWYLYAMSDAYTTTATTMETDGSVVVVSTSINSKSLCFAILLYSIPSSKKWDSSFVDLLGGCSIASSLRFLRSSAPNSAACCYCGEPNNKQVGWWWWAAFENSWNGLCNLRKPKPAFIPGVVWTVQFNSTTLLKQCTPFHKILPKSTWTLNAVAAAIVTISL